MIVLGRLARNLRYALLARCDIERTFRGFAGVGTLVERLERENACLLKTLELVLAKRSIDNLTLAEFERVWQMLPVKGVASVGTNALIEGAGL